MERLVQESYVIDYVLGEMDDGLAEDGGEAMDVDPVCYTQLPVNIHS